MSFKPLETYQVLEKKEVKVEPIVKWTLKRIVFSISRRITFKQKFKNPWTVEVSEFIHESVFYEIFRAIRDYKISYGREIEVVRDKKNSIKEYIIKFNHFGALAFHLKQLTNINIIERFTKINASGNKAEVQATSEKPAIIRYKKSTGAFTIQLHYRVSNRYGNVCSF